VPPESATTVNLTFDEALRSAAGSRLVRQGAYRVVSSAPVTVHQFNPLLFELQQDCQHEQYDPGDERLHDGVCYSYTNDASLLFPASALAPDLDNGDTDVEFFALSRATFEGKPPDSPWQGSPGFVAITGVGTRKVHVRVESSAFTQASPAGSADPLPALAPGGVLERDLMPGDVLQLLSATSQCDDGNAVLDLPFCDPGESFDLTGTHIVADGPVQVISGHDCSDVPFNRVACDHLEESMTPLATWGNAAALAVPSASAGGQYVLRVLSGADDNQLTFDPPVHEPVTLARGQMLEFISSDSVLVRAKDRFLAGQYLIGANRKLVGDPSLSIAVPIDQYRQSYNFVSPSTYTQNIVDVIALDGDVVTLDGNLVTGFTQIGSSRFRTAKVVLPTAGAHEIHGTSAQGFAIVLYGLGSYTSYMLPGGLALAPLVIGI
ncbi:MAG TPA: IgGFc-binding protein, partial [Polyangiales bacterium]